MGFLGSEGTKEHLEDMVGKPFIPLLALPYLAALGEDFARRKGIEMEFKFLDDYIENVRKMVFDGFDLVLFSVNTASALVTYQLSEELNREGIPTVVGGIHPSMLPKEAAPHVTSVAIGEAEPIMDEILEDFLNNRLKPVYRRHRIRDLSGMVMPDWNASYQGNYLPDTLPMETSRGCRNACYYCSTTRFQGPLRRHRPIEDIVREIELLREKGILDNRPIFFTDNNIVSDTDYRKGIWDTTYAKKLFKALIPLKISWVGQGELAAADDPELMGLMAASGCKMLLVGIESLDQETVDHLGKPCNRVEEYVRQIETFHKHGIGVIGSFMFGMDEDTEETFVKTEDFINKYIDIPSLAILTPFPGTVQFRQMKRANRILHYHWSLYDTQHVVFRPKKMSPLELEDNYIELTKRLFSLQAMTKRATRAAMRQIRYGSNIKEIADWLEFVLVVNVGFKLVVEGARRGTLRDFGYTADFEPKHFRYLTRPWG